MISCKFSFSLRFKYVAKTILFDKVFFLLFTAVTAGILELLTHFCLSTIQEPEIWCFLAIVMVKLKAAYNVTSSKISMLNQSLSFTAFLVYHFPRAMHFPRYKNLPWFVKLLCFCFCCVKFQTTGCIISIDFDHFSNLLNYVRGVILSGNLGNSLKFAP